MYLLNICEEPDILRIIYLLKKIFDIVFLLAPIGLIIMITIDLVKSVFSGEEKDTKENNKKIINRIIFAVLLFFVPTIVTALMNLLNNVGIESDYQTCLNNANKYTIAGLQLQDNIKKEKEKNNSGNASTTKPSNTQTDYKSLANLMVSNAKMEVGTKEGTNDDNKYGKALKINNQPWCAIFVTWVAKETEQNGINVFTDIINKNNNFLNWASSSYTIMHFNSESHLKFYYSNHYGGSYTPKAGDYIFFNYDNKNWNKVIEPKIAQHVGLVVSSSNGNVYTIEGNSSSQVREKTYKLSSDSIMGYGVWYD